jgi:hypothetical protein
VAGIDVELGIGDFFYFCGSKLACQLRPATLFFGKHTRQRNAISGLLERAVWSQSPPQTSHTWMTVTR